MPQRHQGFHDPDNLKMAHPGGGFDGANPEDISVSGMELSTGTIRPHTTSECSWYASDDMSAVRSAMGSMASLSELQANSSFGVGTTSTSDTSFGFVEAEWLPSSQPVQRHPPPPTAAHAAQEFSFAEGSWSGGPVPIPHHDNDILSGSRSEDTVVQPSAERTNSERKGVPGVPCNNTHQYTRSPERTAQARRPPKHISDVISMYSAFSAEDRSHTRECMDMVDNGTDGSPSERLENTVGQSWKCLFCNITAQNKGVLTRHIKAQHYPRYEYSCPKNGCPMIQHRKDKIQNHIRCHDGVDPTRYGEKELACPPQCAYCNCTTNSWEEFYSCLQSHQSGPPSIDRGSSRRSSVDHSQGTQQHNSVLVDAPTEIAQATRQIPEPDSSLLGSRMNQLSPQSGGIGRSNSERRRTEPSRVTRNNGPHPPINVNGQPTRGARPRNQHTQRLRPHLNTTRSTQRGQQWQTRRGSSNGITRLPHCLNCGHDFRYCAVCLRMRNPPQSRSSCHKCLDGVSIDSSAIPAVAHHPQQPQQLQSSPEVNILLTDTIDPRYGLLQGETGQMNHVLPYEQLGAGQQVQQLDFGAPVLAADYRYFPRDATFGSDGTYDQNIFFTEDITSPTLSEEELGYSPLSPKSKSPLRGTLWGVLSWKALPYEMVETPSKHWQLPATPKTPIGWPYSDIQASSRKEIQPLSLPVAAPCNCACNTKSLSLNTTTKMAANLSRNRRVEISFAIAPNDPGSILRSRVKVVVKLLSLRGATKKKAQARMALKKAVEPTLGRAEAVSKVKDDGEEEENDDDEEDISDTESIFSHASDTSTASEESSVSDTEDLVLAQADHSLADFEYRFDVDVQSSLSKIAQWTGGLTSDFDDPDETSLDCVDPERLYEYFFRYIVFMIIALGRASDYGFGPRLRD